MKYRDLVLSAIRHQDVHPVPFTMACEESVAGRLDAHYGSAAWRERLPPFIVGCHAVDTDFKAPIDSAHVRDAYGGIWRTDCRPWHLEQPPLAEPSFDGYTFPSAQRFLRPDWKAKALKTCEANPDAFRLGHLGWGLFERSWNLRGFENALVDAVAEPDFYEAMLDRLTCLYLEFVAYTADLPIDGILFGDDWGDQRGVILGAPRWRSLLKPRWARIFKAVHDAGKITFCHSCGSVAEIVPDLIEIGLDVLESVQPEAAGMSPYELKRRFGDRITFWGGLGSQSVLPFGKPAEVQAEVRRLRQEMGRGGGYILAPAKPLQPETPTENAVALLEELLRGL